MTNKQLHNGSLIHDQARNGNVSASKMVGFNRTNLSFGIEEEASCSDMDLD
jgi:hypothetical protein